MTFEYVVNSDVEMKKLNKEEEESLVKKISSKFVEWNSERSANLEMAQKLSDEIFFKNEYIPSGDKTQRWKSKIKMCKTFMFYQTLKSYIWRNTYANVNSMFDVSGETHDSDNASNRQKAMLVDIMERMDYQKTCDQIIDNALLYGELISFTAWKTQTEEYRRPIDFFLDSNSMNFDKQMKIAKAVEEGKNFYVDERVIYDNPYIYPVNPADIVFDSTLCDDWDSCPKIYRAYKTPNDIINNKLYAITKEQAELIQNLVKEGNNNRLKGQEDIVKGSTVEVLEHWGDLKLTNGQLLKNWHAVVVARKYLVYFHKNDALINPFSYGAFVRDPETKRGISPLYSVLSLSQVQEDLLNRTCNLQSLSENPPLLAPEGFFEEDELQLYPGKIIEYGDSLSPAAAFQQLQFNPQIFLQDITFLNDLMAEVSGIFPNMVGALDDGGTKTATEINVKTQGQMTRLAMIVDTINQDLIIPNVEKVAKLCADFKSGVETIFVSKDNKQEYIEVDDFVRQGEYKYTYSDSSSTALKSEQADLVVTAAERFAQVIPLNMQEIFLWYFEQKGVDNPERFLNIQTQQPENNQNLDALIPLIGMLAEGAGVNTQINKNANSEINYQEQNQEINKKTEPATQEKDKRLYPDEIAGVKRGKPMTFEDVVKKGVNPSYDKTAGTDEDDGNCNSCVAAYIYCRRGYDVNAASTLDNKKAEELSHKGLDLWIEAETGEIAKWTEFNNDNQSTFDFLNETIKPGEIYELAQYPQLKAGDLSTVDGHVVVVEKGSDGQLKIYDPQKREVYENSSKTKMYIDSWIDTKEMARDIYPKFIRVDNKQINPYYEGVLVH